MLTGILQPTHLIILLAIVLALILKYGVNAAPVAA